MARTKEGSIGRRNGVLYARLTFADATGKRCQRWRRAKNRAEAKRIIKEMLRELDQ